MLIGAHKGADIETIGGHLDVVCVGGGGRYVFVSRSSGNKCLDLLKTEVKTEGFRISMRGDSC